MNQDFDLVIVGGGLVGNTLAIALQDTGLKIAVIEASSRWQQQTSGAGDRALALGKGTVDVMDSLGIWPAVVAKATAITQIHVSDKGHFGKVRLSAAQEKVNALGYVVTARDIEQSAADLVAQTDVTTFYQTRLSGLSVGEDRAFLHLTDSQGASVNCTAALVVGADGGHSSVRQLLDIGQTVHDYGQTALVATIKTSKSHGNVAFERFTNEGPLAMLPLQNYHSALVWTRRHDEAESLMASGDRDFIDHLQSSFGYRLGRLDLVSPRRSFPLSLVRAEKMIGNRAVLIGNAVHQLHPVAGQGFNLSLRDITALAKAVKQQQAQHQDIGNHEMLLRLSSERFRDHDQTIGFTNSLIHLFSNNNLALAAIRNTGLAMLDRLPLAKQILARHAMGMAGS